MSVDLSVDEIINIIKEEAKDSSDTLKNSIEEKKDNILLNQNNTTFIQKAVYEYPDFTKFHDIEFIKNVYRGILCREADKDGLDYYLNLLRSGKKSKSEIISMIRYSKEGREKNVKLLGSKKRYIFTKLNSIPIFGYIFKTFTTLLTLPKILKRLNIYENYVAQEANFLNSNLLLLETKINKKADITDLRNIENLQAELKQELYKKEEKLYNELENTKYEIKDSLDKKLDRDFEELIQSKLLQKADITDLKNIENLQEELRQELYKKEEKLYNELKNAKYEIKDIISKKLDRDFEELIQSKLLQKADITDLKNIENLQEELRQELYKKEEKLYNELENTATNINIINKNKVGIDEFNLYLQTVNYAKEYMKLSQQNMQELINEAKKRLPKKTFKEKELHLLSQEEKNIYDNFYFEFENMFRGKKEIVKNRQNKYISYLQKLPFDRKKMKIIDIGCGRGEWLELLKENNLKKAKGIDINNIMISECKSNNLDVINSDALEYLSKVDNSSISVITGFHIIEHLKFPILMNLLKESYRVLKKDGMVIFETPNPKNITVGACNFYTDPTHLNPIPPETAKFLLKENGFKNVEIINLEEKENIGTGNDYLNEFINNWVNVSSDYAVIGYKK